MSNQQPPPYGENDPQEPPAGPPGAQSSNPYGTPAPPPPGSGGYQAPPPYQSGGYPGGGYQPPPPRNTLAIVSLVLGIASIPLACCGGYPGLVAGIAAIVLAVLARGKVRRGEAGQAGLATAGMVTGIVGLVISAALLIVGMILGPKMAECQNISDPQQQSQCMIDKLQGK